MVGVQRRPWEWQELWPAGEYTLLADSYITEDRLTYSRGDTFVLFERAATRLGNAGAITPPEVCTPLGPGSRAVRAQSGTSTCTGCGSWPERGGIEGGPKPPTFISRLHISRMSSSIVVPPSSCSETTM
jgi:hypothetical protein